MWPDMWPNMWPNKCAYLRPYPGYSCVCLFVALYVQVTAGLGLGLSATDAISLDVPLSSSVARSNSAGTVECVLL